MPAFGGTSCPAAKCSDCKWSAYHASPRKTRRARFVSEPFTRIHQNSAAKETESVQLQKLHSDVPRCPSLSHLPQMTSFLQKNCALVASNGDPALLHPLKLRKCLRIARSILFSCYFCRALLLCFFSQYTLSTSRALVCKLFGSFGPCLRRSPCACAKQGHQTHLSHINLQAAEAPCPWPGKPASTPRIYEQHDFEISMSPYCRYPVLKFNQKEYVGHFVEVAGCNPAFMETSFSGPSSISTICKKIAIVHFTAYLHHIFNISSH